MTRTSSILFWFSLIIIASLGLYRTSDRTQELERQLRTINASIDTEKQSLHVLNAEWVYLTNPARIQEISLRHSALRPTTPAQVATLETMDDVLPTRSEAAENKAADATPAAAVKTAAVAQLPPPPVLALHPAPKVKPIAVASTNSGHLRDHMMLVQRTASAAPMPGDAIGNLISQLDAGQ